MRRLLCAGLLFLAAWGAHGIHPARADIFVTYIAVSCDASTDRAAVRFGYGDNDDPPVFAPLPELLAARWPTQLVQAKIPKGFQHDQPQEASCQLSNGVEVKARYADTESTRVGWRFSVWVDKKKVVSRAPQTPPGCDGCIVHSLLIDKSTIRRCDFHLPADRSWSAYDVITTPVPIVCADAAPLRGEIDRIEYPLRPDPRRLPAGSMRIENAADERLCRLLVIRSEPNGERDGIYSRVPFGSEIVSLRNVGGEFRQFQPVSLDRFPNEWGGHHNGRVDVAELSLFDRSTSQRVFRVSGGSHYFDGDLFVVTDLDIPQEQVVQFLAQQLSPAGELEDIVKSAAARGWLAFTGDMTAYRSVRYTHFALFRFEEASYLVAYNENWDPAAVLLRPLRSGKLQTLCVFQPVRPNL